VGYGSVFRNYSYVWACNIMFRVETGYLLGISFWALASSFFCRPPFTHKWEINTKLRPSINFHFIGMGRRVYCFLTILPFS